MIFKKKSSWRQPPRSLITKGTGYECVLTAIGAIRAYIAGDDEAVAAYPATFARGYLEIGLLAIGQGALFGCVDHESELEDVKAALSNQSASVDRLLELSKMMSDGFPYVPTSKKAIAADDWQALLLVTLAFIGRMSRQSGATFDEILNNFQTHVEKSLDSSD